jgi:hypothetical protein
MHHTRIHIHSHSTINSLYKEALYVCTSYICIYICVCVFVYIHIKSVPEQRLGMFRSKNEQIRGRRRLLSNEIHKLVLSSKFFEVTKRGRDAWDAAGIWKTRFIAQFSCKILRERTNWET